MLKILWASKDFKLMLVASILNAGLAIVMWYSLRAPFLLGLAVVLCVFPVSQFALKLIIESYLQTRAVSQQSLAIFAGVWEFIKNTGGYALVAWLTFPEILQNATIVFAVLGLSVFFAVNEFLRMRKTEPATPRSNLPPSPPAP